MAEHIERLVGRAEDDPVEMDGEAGHENSEIEIDSSEGREAERDAEEIQPFHAEIICAS